MDNIKIREKGLFQDYRPDSIHRDIIYFATDTCQIFLNGMPYGSKEDVRETIDLADQENSLSIVDNFFNKVSEITSLPSESIAKIIQNFNSTYQIIDSRHTPVVKFQSVELIDAEDESGQQIWAFEGYTFKGSLLLDEVLRVKYIHSQVLESELISTKSIIGLENVDNTSDSDKPVSAAQAAAIADAKKAGTDAASALNTYKTENDAAISEIASNLAAEISRATAAESQITNSLNTKVDKITGKSLSTNDFTNALKSKLEGLNNYDDSALSTKIDNLTNSFNTLVSGNASAAIESFNEIIAFLDNIEDSTTLEGIIAGINTQINNVDKKVTNLTSTVNNKVDKVSGKQLSTNDYTTAEKNKLAGIATGANNYSLPVASSTTRGGVKLGYTASGKNYPVQASEEKLYVNVPWTNTTYSPATTNADGLMSAADKQFLNSLSEERSLVINLADYGLDDIGADTLEKEEEIALCSAYSQLLQEYSVEQIRLIWRDPVSSSLIDFGTPTSNMWNYCITYDSGDTLDGSIFRVNIIPSESRCEITGNSYAALNTVEDHIENRGKEKHIPAGGHERQILSWESDGKAKWEDLSNMFTGLEEFLAYGVEWDVTVADPHLTRIGNMSLHKTLPIQSQLKGCIAQGNKVIYWLDENDWRFRKDPKVISIANSQNLDITGGIGYFTIVQKIDLAPGQYLIQRDPTGILSPIILKVLSVEQANPEHIIYNVHCSVESNKDEVPPTNLEIGSRLDGYDGTVRIYCPNFYIKSQIIGTKRRVWLSTVKIDNTWTYQHEILIDAYRSTVLNTVPENMGYLSTLPVNSAISVVNTATYCRGGSNRRGNDKYLTGADGTEIDIFRTDLGKPRTNQTRSTWRTATKNAGNAMMNYDQYKNIFYWLYVVEYANFNCQETYNETLTEEGYHQGGMGLGVTTENLDYWNKYNGYCPLTPCGYLNEFGNRTAIKAMLRPAFDTIVNGPTLISSHTATNGTSSISSNNRVRTFTAINNTTSSFLYATYANAPGRVTYKVTGLEDGQSIRFEQSRGATVTLLGTLEGNGGEQTIEVEWPNNFTNREIRANFTGACNFTIEIESSVQATLTISERTFQVPRWRGFDNPFGDILTNLDGIIIDADANNHPNNMNYVYTCQDPDKYADNLNGDGYEKVGEEIHQDGYTKVFDLGDAAHIIPNVIGGNATTYKCDYHQVDSKNTILRVLIVGGGAQYGTGAGLGRFSSGREVSYSCTYVGFRSVSRFMSFSSQE